jgi:hypothetical protein
MTCVLKNKKVDFKKKETIALVYDKDHTLLFDKIIKVGCSKLLGVDIVPHCNIPWLSMHGLLWDLPGTVEIGLSCLSSVQ